jgi:nicotinate-nucleotide adenylyltransferase
LRSKLPPPVPARAFGFVPRRRVGLLGGSFNPAHAGHRHIAELALKRLKLDEVWLLVSPGNPLKPQRGMAPLQPRLASAALQTGGHPRLRTTAIETEFGTRYTADTLAALTRRFPRVQFVWLMGADNLAQIPRWESWSSIFKSVPVSVLDRPAYSLGALAGKAAQRFKHARRRPSRAGKLAAAQAPAWVFLHTRLHDATSTSIRAQAAEVTGAPELWPEMLKTG